VQVQASGLLNFVEQLAQSKLDEARQLERIGKLIEARAELALLGKNFAGTNTAQLAAKHLAALEESPEFKKQQRQQRAQELLTLARFDYENKHYLCCLDRCELLVRQYADMSEGQEAQVMLDRIRENPDWMQEATTAIGERWADMQLALAESWIRKGEPNLGMECLRRVVKMSPSPRHVELATFRLAQMEEGPAARQIQFEKPK